MSETPLDWLEQIRRRYVQLLWLYTGCWTVSLVIAALVVAGSLDWLVRAEDVGTRVLLSLAVVTSIAVGGWRLVRGWIGGPPGLVKIALRLERLFPTLRDRLASSVEFLQQGDSTASGSTSLQDATIRDVQERLAGLETTRIWQTQPVKRAGWTAVAMCLLAATLVFVNPAVATTALMRLVVPWQTVEWPRVHHLQLVDEKLRPIVPGVSPPLRMAWGNRLSLFARDLAGELPSDTVLELRRQGDESVSREPMRRTTLRNAAGESYDVAAVGLAVAEGEWELRVVGGDHQSMDWQSLVVVPPPVLRSLHVRLIPPAYLDSEPVVLPTDVGDIQAWMGTRVVVEAEASKPLSEAVLRIADTDPVLAELSEDGTRLKAEFELNKPRRHSYWLQLTDREGYENQDPPRYDVRVNTDAVPDVSIISPSADVRVTPTAEVPVRIEAKDDIGLVGIRFHYRLESEGESEGRIVPLFEGEGLPTQHSAEWNWSLTELSLPPGMRLFARAEATDAFDLGVPHVGRSVTRTLTVVSPQEKTTELLARQRELNQQLDQTLKMQVQTRDQVAELALQLEQAGQLKPQDKDLLKRVELDQRRITAQLGDAPDGASFEVRRLLEELTTNRLEQRGAQLRLEHLQDELAALRESLLPGIEQSVTQARKLAFISGNAEASGSRDSSQQPAPDRSAVDRATPPASNAVAEGSSPQSSAKVESSGERRPAERAEQKPGGSRTAFPSDLAATLQESLQLQSAVARSLQSLLEDADRWQTRQEIESDLALIDEQQQSLQKATSETGRQTISKSFNDLSDQQRADLARLAERQRSQAEALDRFLGKMNQQLERHTDTQAELPDGLEASVEQLRESAVALSMRQAADAIQQNRMGHATTRQSQIAEGLSAARELLTSDAMMDHERQVAELGRLDDELETLVKRQTETTELLMQKSAELETDAAEMLRREQERITAEARKTARGLRRWRAGEADKAAGRATRAMERAVEELTQRHRDPAHESQQQAADDLRQARRELARERDSIEQALLFEKFEKVVDELDLLAARQQTVIDEIARLEQIRLKDGRWNRSQLKSLRDISQVELQLAEETDRVAEQLSIAEVFALTVGEAARLGRQVAELLERRQTDRTAQSRGREMKTHLLAAVAALKYQQDPEQQSQKPANTPGQQQPQGQRPGDVIPPLAQISLMRSMQLQLIRRTEELERQGGQSNVGQDRLAGERREIAVLQQRLAAAVSKLLEGGQPQSMPEETPQTPSKQELPAGKDPT